MNYAYVRVSTVEQNVDRQVLAMKAAKIKKQNIFTDKVSGKDFERPEYKNLLSQIQEGDAIFIKSIDRLGRNYEDVQEQWRIITKERKVDIVVLDMPILDTRKGKDLMGTFLSDVVLALLSYISQVERENIRQRQKEGIAAAKLRGVKFGRPEAQPPENLYEISLKWQAGIMDFEQALSETGLKQSTFFRMIKKIRCSKFN
jgi:DNA invertase Pin-like site-specific DNA recombinase